MIYKVEQVNKTQKGETTIYTLKVREKNGDYLMAPHTIQVFDAVGNLVETTVEERPLTIAVPFSREEYQDENSRHGKIRYMVQQILKRNQGNPQLPDLDGEEVDEIEGPPPNKP